MTKPTREELLGALSDSGRQKTLIDEIVFGMFFVERCSNEDGTKAVRRVSPERVRFNGKNGRYEIVDEPNPFQGFTVEVAIVNECAAFGWGQHAAEVIDPKRLSWNVACRVPDEGDERDSRNGIGLGKGAGWLMSRKIDWSIVNLTGGVERWLI